MPKLRPWIGADLYPIHQSWMDVWATDLTVTKLRKEIWNAERFSGRILASFLADHEATPKAPEKPSDIVAVILAASRGAFIRKIGLNWMAPVLANYLLHKKTRFICGELTLAEIRMVAEHRKHTTQDMIDPIGAGRDPANEGEICLFAWTSTLPMDIAKRVRLLLPRMRDDFQRPDAVQNSARADLVWALAGGQTT